MTVTASRAPGQEQTLLVEVTARADEAEGVVALQLTGADSTPLPCWEPGAHIDLVLSSGLVRQYSLCGLPERSGDSWRIAVLLEPDGRGGSRHVHERLAPGDRLEVRGPRNNFCLEPAERYLFIAGGIGITPILPMLHRASAQGTPWSLVYGGRSRSSMAFTDDLPAGGCVEICPEDEVGTLNLDRWLGKPQHDTLVYCCGPEGLLNAVEQQCASWPSRSLHTERFVPTRQRSSAEAFVVELSRSGERLDVGEHECMLEVLEAAGHDVTNSCRAGICGTCLTGVVDGVPEHLDDVLSDEERAGNQLVLPCVSRSRTDVLVLDL